VQDLHLATSPDPVALVDLTVLTIVSCKKPGDTSQNRAGAGNSLIWARTCLTCATGYWARSQTCRAARCASSRCGLANHLWKTMYA
jgi:hypothetical protein